ncbi:hypothetical protein TSUD_357990 [Trifolium subterraneum]|uniref:EF-hand domain-containing protein n=1 Tax=Trifolium subterraneum TaxID=3900 RepID=A0A2Z6N884_TRISU|nr:hypothetical protein TSUD_357990 [Trifolium subterraneum]
MFYGQISMAHSGAGYEQWLGKVIRTEMGRSVLENSSLGSFIWYLTDTELLPVIGKLYPSEHYYATKQSENFISQVQDDKDGHLSLTEMIENARILYAAIFPDEFF